MSYLTVRTRLSNGTLVVYIEGYLNSLLGEEVERVVGEFLAGGGRSVLLNFTGTRLINSIGISIVIGIVERLREENGILAFCSLSRINRDLFRITGVTRHVHDCASEEDALAALSRNP
jgi:anti-anti-sigma factor